MLTFKKTVLLGLLAIAGHLSNAHASLVGETITATGYSLTPVSATIGNGIEFTGLYGYLDFDFSADTLTLSSTRDLESWGNGWGTYTFSGFSSEITGISIASNNGFTGTVLSNFSFTSHSITLDMEYGNATKPATLVFNIQSVPAPGADVPEPATLGVFGLGMLGLVASRRKLTKRSA